MIQTKILALNIGVTTLSITTFDITTLSITTFNITTLSITTFDITTLSITAIGSGFTKFDDENDKLFV
jgi:hypothetical protein